MCLKCYSMPKYLQQMWNLAYADNMKLTLSQPLSLKMSFTELFPRTWGGHQYAVQTVGFFFLQMEIFSCCLSHQQTAQLAKGETHGFCVFIHFPCCYLFCIWYPSLGKATSTYVSLSGSHKGNQLRLSLLSLEGSNPKGKRRWCESSVRRK